MDFQDINYGTASSVSECVMFLISSKQIHLYQSDIMALGRELIDNETTTSVIINLVQWGRTMLRFV